MLKFHDWHARWVGFDGYEAAFVVGIAAGRVSGEPVARHLYSVRLLLGVVKMEVLFWSGWRGN